MSVIDQLCKISELYKLVKSYILSICLISNTLTVISVLFNKELADQFEVELPEYILFVYN